MANNSWECLKYKIRKFLIKFSKLLSKNTKTQNFFLEKKKLKLLECTANYLDISEYISYKIKLDQFYEKKQQQKNKQTVPELEANVNHMIMVKNLQSSF